ncbi:MAG: hypothetical protein KAJ42_07635 [Gemmatimonadetes bacterium]|nr:hypothetical protein [Gemmatimonadota bacterium]
MHDATAVKGKLAALAGGLDGAPGGKEAPQVRLASADSQAFTNDVTVNFHGPCLDRFREARLVAAQERGSVLVEVDCIGRARPVVAIARMKGHDGGKLGLIFAEDIVRHGEEGDLRVGFRFVRRSCLRNRIDGVSRSTGEHE